MIPKTAGETGQVRRVAFSAWAWILSLFFGLLFVGLTILTIGTWFLGQDTMTDPVTDLGFFALGGVIVGVGFAVQRRPPTPEACWSRRVTPARLVSWAAALRGSLCGDGRFGADHCCAGHGCQL